MLENRLLGGKVPLDCYEIEDYVNWRLTAVRQERDNRQREIYVNGCGICHCASTSLVMIFLVLQIVILCSRVGVMLKHRHGMSLGTGTLSIS